MKSKLSRALVTAVVLLDMNLVFAETHVEAPPAVVGGMKSTPRSQEAVAQRRKAQTQVKQININAASKSELKKIPGIGDDEADRIIANRPYQSKTWLVTKGVIPDGIYINIKNRIVAGKPIGEAKK